MKNLALTHANVYDGKLASEFLKDMTILVKIFEGDNDYNGIIESIGPATEIDIPLDYKIINLKGKYVIPGLINAHCHLVSDGKPMKILHASDKTLKRLKKLILSPIGKILVLKRMKKNLQSALNSGVTTIRNAGDPGYYDVITKKKIENGKFPGPRLIVAGQSICVTGGHGALLSHIVDNPWEGRKAVRDCLRNGSDVIKILSTGGVTDARRVGEAGRLQMTVEEISAVCDEAHRAGIKVMAHAESTMGVKEALLGGVDSIEHGAPIDEECKNLFLRNPKSLNGYSTLVSTLSAPMDLSELGKEILKVPEVVQKNSDIVRDGMIEGLREAIKSGIKLGMGTDASVPFVPHYEFWRELVYYQHFTSLSPKEALNIATEKNAQLLGIEDITGTIEPGKSADFVIFHANPLENLLNLENPAHVVFRGHIILNPTYKKVKEIEKHTSKRFFSKTFKQD